MFRLTLFISVFVCAAVAFTCTSENPTTEVVADGIHYSITCSAPTIRYSYDPLFTVRKPATIALEPALPSKAELATLREHVLRLKLLSNTTSTLHLSATGRSSRR